MTKPEPETMPPRLLLDAEILTVRLTTAGETRSTMSARLGSVAPEAAIMIGAEAAATVLWASGSVVPCAASSASAEPLEAKPAKTSNAADMAARGAFPTHELPIRHHFPKTDARTLPIQGVCGRVYRLSSPLSIRESPVLLHDVACVASRLRSSSHNRT